MSEREDLEMQALSVRAFNAKELRVPVVHLEQPSGLLPPSWPESMNRVVRCGHLPRVGRSSSTQLATRLTRLTMSRLSCLTISKRLPLADTS